MRILKIEEAGHFTAKRVFPKIRLQGRWLERAGFTPNERVRVFLGPNRTLVLQAIPTVRETENSI